MLAPNQKQIQNIFSQPNQQIQGVKQQQSQQIIGKQQKMQENKENSNTINNKQIQYQQPQQQQKQQQQINQKQQPRQSKPQQKQQQQPLGPRQSLNNLQMVKEEDLEESILDTKNIIDNNSQKYDPQCPPHLIKEFVLEHYEELVSTFDFIKSEEFGEIKIFRMHPFVKYLASKKIASSKIDLDQRTSIRNPHLFFTMAYQIDSPSTSLIYFEYNFQSLAKLNEKRIQQNLLMPEKEILCMTKGITYALRHLQMLGVSHGDLRTKNIYFDVDYFLFRVYDNELINGPFSLFRKSLEQFQEIVYLAPELIESTTVSLLSQVNVYKSDVFTFGMVLLECATLCSAQDLYDTNLRVIRWELIYERLKLVSKYYSVYLSQFIQILLDPRPETRPDWNDLALQLHDPSLFDLTDHQNIPFKLRFSSISKTNDSMLRRSYQQIQKEKEIPQAQRQWSPQQKTVNSTNFNSGTNASQTQREIKNNQSNTTINLNQKIARSGNQITNNFNVNANNKIIPQKNQSMNLQNQKKSNIQMNGQIKNNNFGPNLFQNNPQMSQSQIQNPNKMKNSGINFNQKNIFQMSSPISLQTNVGIGMIPMNNSRFI